MIRALKPSFKGIVKSTPVFEDRFFEGYKCREKCLKKCLDLVCEKIGQEKFVHGGRCSKPIFLNSKYFLQLFVSLWPVFSFGSVYTFPGRMSARGSVSKH